MKEKRLERLVIGLWDGAWGIPEPVRVKMKREDALGLAFCAKIEDDPAQHGWDG